MVTVGLLVTLETKPGKEEAVEEFLRSALPLVEAEEATTAWFAVRLSESSFGIFDVFPDDTGRDAHLSGPVAEALHARADDLFASPPKVERAEVIAAKLR